MLSTALEYWAGRAPGSSAEKCLWSSPGETHSEDCYSLLLSLSLFSSSPVCSWILRLRHFYHLNALLKNHHFFRRRKIPDFLLWLSTFFMSGSKIPHGRSLREDSRQTGCFTPTDCLGLLQVSFWVVQSKLRWNWNYRILILVLILLFTSIWFLWYCWWWGAVLGHLQRTPFPWKAGVEGEAGAPGYLLLRAALCAEARNSSGRWWALLCSTAIEVRENLELAEWMPLTNALSNCVSKKIWKYFRVNSCPDAVTLNLPLLFYTFIKCRSQQWPQPG